MFSTCVRVGIAIALSSSHCPIWVHLSIINLGDLHLYTAGSKKGRRFTSNYSDKFLQPSAAGSLGCFDTWFYALLTQQLPTIIIDTMVINTLGSNDSFCSLFKENFQTVCPPSINNLGHLSRIINCPCCITFMHVAKLFLKTTFWMLTIVVASS